LSGSSLHSLRSRAPAAANEADQTLPLKEPNTADSTRVVGSELMPQINTSADIKSHSTISNDNTAVPVKFRAIANKIEGMSNVQDDLHSSPDQSFTNLKEEAKGSTSNQNGASFSDPNISGVIYSSMTSSAPPAGITYLQLAPSSGTQCNIITYLISLL